MFRVALFFFCGLSCAHADEHLIPEDSEYARGHTDEYRNWYVEYFKASYEHGVVARLIVQPSFETEHVVGLRVFKEKAYIFSDLATMQVWGFEPNGKGFKVVVKNGKPVSKNGYSTMVEAKYPAEFQDIPKLSCSREIEIPLALHIRRAWQEVLLETKYPTGSRMGGRDGINYHFSAKSDDYFEYAGKVWTPAPQSRPGKLVKIASIMSEYCWNGNRKVVHRLDDALASLTGGAKVKSQSRPSSGATDSDER